ncbi:MAG TPA: penicillin-binding transpeptidase domain-containing protein [Solirubrobacteraceae bacterium]|nr:penicillin-binding transpeptidase domain-containing protein [Solirubrobacteraceae bacterium]
MWRRRLRLLVPVVAVAAIAVGVVLVLGNSSARSERRLVTNYVQAWSAGDYSRMYSLLDPASKAAISQARLAAAYRHDAMTATMLKLTPERIGRRRGDFIPVQMLVTTKLFGTLHETLEVPLTGSGSDATVHYTSSLLFPGLQGHEHLARHMSLPPRATLFAADGSPLAQGPDRTSTIPDVAAQIVGALGPIPQADAATYAADGYPADAHIGVNGLERAFQTQLAGTPGGVLLAGKRALAKTVPIRGQDVTTTIEPNLERAAVAALGGSYAGIAAMDPRTGALLALAGIAFSAAQPPGSTMKIVTTTAALAAGIVKLSTVFPYSTQAILDGYTLHNASGEDCGGTLLNSFAVSCNSVFAPLGAKVGGKALLAMADRFGFNTTPTIPGAAESSIPPDSLGSDLEVGSSAIGQGQVLATPLEMTDVGATIAMGGRRPVPTLEAHRPPKFVHVTSRHVAGMVQQAMVAVVEFGTGTAAAIPGVTVAGKTGTAELANTTTANGQSVANANQLTDAWFVGYAPVGHPRIVVGALFPNQGAGGATAAPAVRQVLVAGLEGH